MEEERNLREELDEIIRRHPELIPTALNLVTEMFQKQEVHAKRVREE